HAGGDPPGVDVVDLLVVELVGEVEHGPRHSPGGGELARVLLEGGGADEGVGACLEGPDAPGVAGDSGVADVEHVGSDVHAPERVTAHAVDPFDLDPVGAQTDEALRKAVGVAGGGPNEDLAQLVEQKK